MYLPLDIILIIAKFLPIYDKRNLVKCNKKLNTIFEKIAEQIKLLKVKNAPKKYLSKTQTIAIEIACDGQPKKMFLSTFFQANPKYFDAQHQNIQGYAHLLPERHIYKSSKAFYNDANLYWRAEYNNFLELIKLLLSIEPSQENWLSQFSRDATTKKRSFAYFFLVEHQRVHHLICAGAASNGNLKLLKWTHKNDFNYYLTCRGAAKNGHLKVLKWVKKIDRLQYSVCSLAASYGHFEIVKWARENNCGWDRSICAGAARGGHLEMLKWARESHGISEGCEWDSSTCAQAALAGNMEILKWARGNGCEWNSSTCAGATRCGDL